MTIAIVGMGASLTDTDVMYLRGRCRVLCLNETYQLAPWADYLYACDAEWWRYYHPDVCRTFSGDRWTQVQRSASDPEVERRQADEMGIHWVWSIRGNKWQDAPDVISQGGNSGHQSIQLAVKWGYRRIILLGFDGTKGTWMRNRPKQFVKASPHKRWLENAHALATDLRAMGVEVINCTPRTQYSAYEAASLRSSL